MAHVFFRVTTGDFLINREARRQRGLFGVRAGVNVVNHTGCGGRRLRGRLFRNAGFQDIDNARAPFGSRGLVFDVGIYAIQQALAAQFGQLAVKIFARLAEEFVGGVAKAEDRKGGARQFWRFFREQEFMQRHRFFRRLTFALGRGHNDNQLL